MMDWVHVFRKYHFFLLNTIMYVLDMLQVMLVAGYMINMDQPLIMCVLRISASINHVPTH
jgi:hypothetical protein